MHTIYRILKRYAILENQTFAIKFTGEINNGIKDIYRKRYGYVND